MAIQDSFIHELLSKNDIASVVGEYVQLEPRGGRLWARCPFHNEKTASFHISPEKQLYYCFGCHVGGGVIQFIMAIERLTYYEAVKHLAARVGMELPGEIDDQRLRANRRNRERLWSACRDAALFYHANLLQSDHALKYLYKRGITPAMIKRFGLGYSPEAWDMLYQDLTLTTEKSRYTEKELIEAGLVRRKDDSAKPYDAFRNRIMFPIISERGNVLGFGARALGNEVPKYLNTGQTRIFNKRYNLYGLNLCKREKLSDLIIVEGYMDAISLHTAGITNVVASLGTALTSEQARLIKRYTQNVYIAYDGDSAGQHATLRGMDILAKQGLIVKVISLPDNLDPDDYCRRYGGEAFLKLKDEALALNAYRINTIAREYNLSNEDARQQFVVRACQEINLMQPVEQERYLNLVSVLTGFSHETVERQAKRMANGEKNTFSGFWNNKENKLPFAKNEREKHELLLAACAASSMDAAKYVNDNAMEYVSSPAIREFVTAVKKGFDEGGVAVADILSNMQEQESASAIAAALSQDSMENPLQAAIECTIGLKRSFYKHSLMELSAALDNGEIDAQEYLNRYNSINAELKGLG